MYYKIMSVDFAEVNRNIKKDNLDIRLIRIIYEDLSEFEEREILQYQGGEKASKGKILSYYPENLDPLYKEKAKGVLFLGAD